MNSYLEQMLRQVEADGRASQALRDFRKRGLDVESVLNGLFLFCGGSAEDVREGLASAKDSRDRFINLAHRAEQLANDVELIRPQMEQIFDYRRYSNDLPALLREEAQWVRCIVHAKVGPYLDGVKVGVKTERPKGKMAPVERKTNITAGRAQHLVYR
jgi:hypothetical protein